METRTSEGIGFGGLLTIAFVVLKLTGVIQWSWIWVISPIWISFLLFVGTALIVCTYLWMTDQL